MDFSKIFLDDEHRLRSGWRFAIFLVGLIILATVLAAPVALAFPPSTTESPESHAVYLMLISGCSLISALVVGWLCNRFLDGLPFSSLGAAFTKGWLRNLAVGLAIGMLTLCVAIGIAVAFGGLSFTTDQVDLSSVARTFGFSLAIFSVAAASEEALFRGYPTQTFFHSRLGLFGVLFTSLLFAAAHGANPGADPLSALNTFLAGVWFGVAYFKTRSLWFPFGMHLMWNWMLGAFFGIEVSGIAGITSAPLLNEIDRGPAWLTGEAYGIEAGVACTAAIIMSTLAIYFWPQKTEQKHER